MITIHELLEDKVFREYFTTKPQMPANLPPIPYTPQWRVMIQRQTDGRWAKKEFFVYIDAFKFLKPLLKNCHDATIQSKGIAWPQISRRVRITRGGKSVMVKGTDGLLYPKTKEILWVPKLPADEAHHTWCPYCRRPTIFGWFSQHHTFGRNGTFDPSIRRCTICGSSERLVGYA